MHRLCSSGLFIEGCFRTQNVFSHRNFVIARGWVHKPDYRSKAFCSRSQSSHYLNRNRKKWTDRRSPYVLPIHWPKTSFSSLECQAPSSFWESSGLKSTGAVTPSNILLKPRVPGKEKAQLLSRSHSKQTGSKLPITHAGISKSFLSSGKTALSSDS